jgi:hypothetical protein
MTKRVKEIQLHPLDFGVFVLNSDEKARILPNMFRLAFS